MQDTKWYEEKLADREPESQSPIRVGIRALIVKAREILPITERFTEGGQQWFVWRMHTLLHMYWDHELEGLDHLGRDLVEEWTAALDRYKAETAGP